MTGGRGSVRLWLVFAGAALPRLAYLLLARPAFEGYHWMVAETLLRQGVIGFEGLPSAAYDPLYAVWLSLARWISGDRILVVQALQACIDAVGAVGVFVLATSLTGRRRAALLAAALYASYPLLVHHAVVADEFSLLSVLLIAFAATVVSGATVRHAALAGVWLGLAILTRSMVAPLVGLTAGLLLLDRRYMAALVLVATTVAVVSPWVVRNHALTGSVWPTRGGENLYHGNSPYTAALLPEYNTDLLWEHGAAIVRQQRPDLFDPAAEAGLDRFYMALAWNGMRAHPVDAGRLMLMKAVYFFWPRLVPSRVRRDETQVVFEPGGRVRVTDSPSRPLLEEIGYSVPYAIVLSAALGGVWRRRASLRRDAVLWCIVLTFTATAAIFFPATRYRVPMEFVLLFYAAVALDALMDSFRATSDKIACKSTESVRLI
ncbi:MAG: glycosyltransferase family 39 protein [Acidobacteria bacterium]|nr:glycosyltransferase family 39 protein [Acidobacteriota bacterium]